MTGTKALRRKSKRGNQIIIKVAVNEKEKKKSMKRVETKGKKNGRRERLKVIGKRTKE